MARASGGGGGRGHRKRASRWRDRDDRLALFSRSGRQSRRSQQPGRSPMSDTLLTVLQYYGAGAATFAALPVSLNLGRRWTGWAFVIFVTSSLALIGWGFLQPDSEGIGWQNIALRSEERRVGKECVRKCKLR